MTTRTTRGRATIPTAKPGDVDLSEAFEPDAAILPPGTYEAVVTSLLSQHYGGRRYLEARFTIFDGPITNAVPIA
jgi:hypothetical protein